MLSHTRMGVPYEYTHMRRLIRVWANIRIWARTTTPNALDLLQTALMNSY